MVEAKDEPFKDSGLRCDGNGAPSNAGCVLEQ